LRSHHDTEMICITTSKNCKGTSLCKRKFPIVQGKTAVAPINTCALIIDPQHRLLLLACACLCVHVHLDYCSAAVARA